MTNHPGRTVAAALKVILKGHEQYQDADSAGREIIRANIRQRLHDSVDTVGSITADRLVAWYNRNGLTAGENVTL